MRRRASRVDVARSKPALRVLLLSALCLAAFTACGGSSEDNETSEDNADAANRVADVVESVREEGLTPFDTVRETLEELEASDPDDEIVADATDYLGVLEEQPLVTGEAAGAEGVAVEDLRSSPPDAASVPEVVKRHAPLVVFHPDEWLFPLDASLFLDNAALMWAREECEPAGIAGGASSDRVGDLPLLAADELGAGDYSGKVGCTADGGSFSSDRLTRPYDPARDRPSDLPATEGFFLELDDEYRTGDPVARDAGEATGIPVYYDYEPGRYVTYWFLYGGSASPLPEQSLDAYVTALAHEGDWERISVRLNAQDEPTHVFYAQHRTGEELTWNETPVIDETHPIVYSALGTHASEPSLGVTELSCPVRDICFYDFAEASESRWRTWEHLRPVENEPWYGFGGAWGTNWPTKDLSGPLGPSLHKEPTPDGW